MPRDNQKENQTKVEKFLSEKTGKVFLIETFLFVISFILGIFSAFKTSRILKAEQIVIEKISFWDFIFSFFAATLFIVFFVYFFKPKKTKKIIYKLLFLFVVFGAGILLLESFLKEPLPLFLISILLFWWYKKPIVLNQDILVILAIAGVGGFLGLAINYQTVFFLLIIFSLYDFFAVYKTKHMVKMANEMVENQAILGIVLPQNLFQFSASLAKVKPGGEFFILGAGDFVFPLLFSVSLLSEGLTHSIIVAFFSLIGLLASFYIFVSQKNRQPLPALPFIVFFSLIGFFVSRFF